MTAHARIRAAERAGLCLAQRDFAWVASIIEAGAAAYLADDPNPARTHWLVPYAGRSLTVVYDERGGAIVTVLPRVPHA